MEVEEEEEEECWGGMHGRAVVGRGGVGEVGLVGVVRANSQSREEIVDLCVL